MARPAGERIETHRFDEIKQYRLAHGLTQLQMAQILGMTRNAYANEEHTNFPPPVQVWRIFSAYRELPRPAEDCFAICLVWNGDVFVPTDTRASTRRCAWCDEPFWTTVHNKRFCSEGHRYAWKNANRRKK